MTTEDDYRYAEAHIRACDGDWPDEPERDWRTLRRFLFALAVAALSFSAAVILAFAWGQ